MPGTRCISARELREGVVSFRKDHGRQKGTRLFARHLTEALENGDLKPEDFSIRELFQELTPNGREVVEHWQRPKSGWGVELMEAGGDAVAYTDFSGIVGQLFFTKIKENYNYPSFIFSAEIPSIPSAIQDIEKIPEITEIGSVTEGVGENVAYPRFGVGKSFTQVAAKVKGGGIVEVTKEAVAGDLTGNLLRNCGKIGYWLGYNREERAIDAIIDQNAGAQSVFAGGHRYTWNGTAYATYQSTSPWINVKTSNAFTDETSIDALWQILIAITDPYTGKPILQDPKHLILPPSLRFRGERVGAATEVRQTAPGYATTGSPAQTVSPPALQKVLPGLKLLSSQILAARMSTASETGTDWFLGDVSQAVNHFYNWDITSESRSTGTDAEFERDVAYQFKASVKDVFNVQDPRFLARASA